MVFYPQAVIDVLPIISGGLLGVFTVIVIIWASIAIMVKVFK